MKYIYSFLVLAFMMGVLHFYNVIDKDVNAPVLIPKNIKLESTSPTVNNSKVKGYLNKPIRSVEDLFSADLDGDGNTVIGKSKTDIKNTRVGRDLNIDNSEETDRSNNSKSDSSTSNNDNQSESSVNNSGLELNEVRGIISVSEEAVTAHIDSETRSVVTKIERTEEHLETASKDSKRRLDNLKTDTRADAEDARGRIRQTFQQISGINERVSDNVIESRETNRLTQNRLSNVDRNLTAINDTALDLTKRLEEEENTTNVFRSKTNTDMVLIDNRLFSLDRNASKLSKDIGFVARDLNTSIAVSDAKIERVAVDLAAGLQLANTNINDSKAEHLDLESDIQTVAADLKTLDTVAGIKIRDNDIRIKANKLSNTINASDLDTLETNVDDGKVFFTDELAVIKSNLTAESIASEADRRKIDSKIDTIVSDTETTTNALDVKIDANKAISNTKDLENLAAINEVKLIDLPKLQIDLLKLDAREEVSTVIINAKVDSANVAVNAVVTRTSMLEDRATLTEKNALSTNVKIDENADKDLATKIVADADRLAIHTELTDNVKDVSDLTTSVDTRMDDRDVVIADNKALALADRNTLSSYVSDLNVSVITITDTATTLSTLVDANKDKAETDLSDATALIDATIITLDTRELSSTSQASSARAVLDTKTSDVNTTVIANEVTRVDDMNTLITRLSQERDATDNILTTIATRIQNIEATDITTETRLTALENASSANTNPIMLGSFFYGVCVPDQGTYPVDGFVFIDVALAEFLTNNPIQGFNISGDIITAPNWKGMYMGYGGALGLTSVKGQLYDSVNKSHSHSMIGTDGYGGDRNAVLHNLVNIGTVNNWQGTLRTYSVGESHARPATIGLDLCIIGTRK